MASSRAAALVGILSWMAGSGWTTSAQSAPSLPILDLWSSGRVAFGVYAPDENPAPRRPARKAIYSPAGAERLAANPLYDFVFLNLEEDYDAPAIGIMAKGLAGPGGAGRKALIVRIPPIGTDPATAKGRVKEALDLGADGVTIPHVANVDEARQAIGFFRDAGANVWSPSNPSGRTIAMLMLEDPVAVAQAAAVADLPGFSILACGIGSLTQALGGDRAGAEAGTQRVLAETKRTRHVNMLTASPKDVDGRVKEGFLALLSAGPTADETIRLGRTAAGR
ncbi:MAG: aldolase/citrate lyase family protein [Vicinamibacterales bacterium]